MRSSRILLALWMVLAICGLAAPSARAQTTSGTLVGTVYKPTGEPLAGARVVATNELNGNSRATLTAADGSYRIPFMPPGRYTIRASLAGLTDSQITGFPIPLNSTTNLVPPITLGQPGATPVTTPIGTPPTATAASSGARTEGEARASLVNTNDATRRGNFAREQVEALPLGGTTETRTFDELALLVPGVAPPPYVPGVRGPGVGFGVGTAGEFSVNGSRARSNNFTVDGSDNNDQDVGVRRQGFVSLVPQSIESIQEFQISTSLWDAEGGRNVGSQVNAVSKSGGNEVHGTLYGFFTDSALNARNAFDFTGGPSGGEDPYTRVQAGFVIGGPIVKDRTQFFASYERQEINASVEQHFSVPQASERAFLPGISQFGVVPPGPSFLHNIGFVTDVDLHTTPIGNNVLSLYPLPNNPGGPYGENTFTNVEPASGNGNVASFKVTHKLNENNALNARYNFTNDDRILPSVNRAINSSINSDTTTHNFSLIVDTALSPTLFNQGRFSYGRTHLEFPEYPGSPFLFEKSSITTINDLDGVPRGYTSDTFPIGELIVEPFSPVGVDVYTFPQGRTNNTFQFADSVSWTRGSHSIKFGADVRRNLLDSLQNRNYRPLVVFGNGLRAFGNLIGGSADGSVPFDFQALSGIFPLDGAELAAFGTPSSLLQVITKDAPDSSIKLRFTEYDFFVNDTWRMRPNFVLDYGVRYELNTVPKEADHKIEDSLALEGIPPSEGSVVASPAAEAAFDRSLASLTTLLGGREHIYDSDPNNFGPHLGFAWDPWSDGRTSIRGGYGVAFDTILGAVVSQSRNLFPDEIPINVSPDFLGTSDILSLPNPSVLAIRDSDGNVIRNLIAPGTVNQFGGQPEDFVPLIGTLLLQNYNSGGIAVTLPEKNIATPYVQQWHLTIERQFHDDYAFSVAYVGTKGTKLTRLTTPNLGPNTTPFLPIAGAVQIGENFFGPTVVGDKVQAIIGTRPDPSLGAIQRFENSASSIYHALQVEAHKRYSHGYTFSFAYTWSHAIDEVSDVFPIAGASNLPQDSFDLAAERASANFDVRHRFATSVVWDLPFYRDHGDADVGTSAWFLGGWQIATIAQGNTGQPFTLQVPYDLNLDGNLTDRPLTTDGLTFYHDHGSQRVSTDPAAMVSDFVFYPYAAFDSKGFLTIQGQNGNVGRNTVRADGSVNWDLALNKHFRFSETQSLELRTEAFNILNRTNYGIPVRTLFSPGFGSSIETTTPARVIQFALKYSF